MRLYVPSMLTLCNLLLGCFAIVAVFRGNWFWVPWMVFAAGWFDMFDGLAARKLNVSSELGKELDSLADMITFGLVPGVIMFELLNLSFATTNLPFEKDYLFALPGFLITAFSALRLAKFNIDTRQTKGFLGLATPACTMFFLGLTAGPLGKAGIFQNVISNSYILYAITGIFSFLLVSEIPMFSAKSKSFKWKDNKVVYLFFIYCISILIIFGVIGFAICSLSYIVLSLILNQLDK